MATMGDVQVVIDKEFGSRLKPEGFRQLGPRLWVRSTKAPIREYFSISARKGAQYLPIWGFSSGIAPYFNGYTFRRQTTDRNSTFDLTLNEVWGMRKMPPEAFHFISGYDDVPRTQIGVCAAHFVPLALADFDRVHSLDDFCGFLVERRRSPYFSVYIQQEMTYGLVLILRGERTKGLRKLEGFCKFHKTKFNDPVLQECIRNVESLAVSSKPLRSKRSAKKRK